MGPNPTAAPAAAASTPAVATGTPATATGTPAAPPAGTPATAKIPPAPSRAAATASVKELRADESLLVKQRLVSPNGKHWLAVVDTPKLKVQLWSSDVVVLEIEEKEREADADDGRELFSRPIVSTPAVPRLTLRANGALALLQGDSAVWSSDDGLLSAAVAKNAVLTVQDDGHATVLAGGERLWYTYCQKDGSGDRSRLVAGEWLGPGQALVSPSGKLSLSLQPNGDLALCKGVLRLWSTKAVAAGSFAQARVTLRDDDNLWIGAEGAPEWTSKTRRRRAGGSAVLRIVEADEAAVLESDGAVLWWTKPSPVPAWEPQKLVPADAKSDRVLSGQYLPLQQTLCSANNQFCAFIQPDGICIQRPEDDSITLWSSRPNAKPSSRLRLGLDGNLVLAAADSSVVWESKSVEWAGQIALVMQNNGNLVLKAGEKTYWSSGSVFPATAKFTLDRLIGGESLLLDQRLKSQKGDWSLRFTAAAQFIIQYAKDDTSTVYYTIPFQQGARMLSISPSGNLEIRGSPDRQLKWSSGSQKSGTSTAAAVVDPYNVRFVMQDDGNAVLSVKGPQSMDWVILWDARSWPRGTSPTQVSDRLVSNATNSKAMLTLGQGIISPSGEFYLWLKLDGELELNSKGRRRLWSAGSAGKTGVDSVILDGVGTLVVNASKEKRQVWTSRDATRYDNVSNAELIIQDSGSVVIVSSGRTVWQINPK